MKKKSGDEYRWRAQALLSQERAQEGMRPEDCCECDTLLGDRFLLIQKVDMAPNCNKYMSFASSYDVARYLEEEGIFGFDEVKVFDLMDKREMEVKVRVRLEKRDNPKAFFVKVPNFAEWDNSGEAATALSCMLEGADVTVWETEEDLYKDERKDR